MKSQRIFTLFLLSITILSNTYACFWDKTWDWVEPQLPQKSIAKQQPKEDHAFQNRLTLKSLKDNSIKKQPLSQEPPEKVIQRYVETNKATELDTFLKKLSQTDKKNLLAKKLTLPGSQQKPFITDFVNLAVNYKYPDVTTVLLKHGADSHTSASDGYCPLTRAADNNQPNIIELLITYGANINTRDENGNAALHIAVQKSHENLIPFLFMHGANINQAQKNGFYAIDNAIHNKDYVMVEMLVNHGANLNQSSPDGFSPLTIAVDVNHPKIIELLIKHGAKINAYDKNGNTALYHATRKSHVNLIGLLVKHGAKSNFACAQGFTPLDVAVTNSDEPMIKTLVKHGAKINGCGNGGFSPITRAAAKNLPNIIRLLVKLGAKINNYDKNGNTAFYRAVRSAFVNLIPLLVELGADVTLPCKDGFLPLSIAIDNNDNSMIEMLAKHGANLSQCGNDGYSPLTRAASKNLPSMIELLVKLGAHINGQDNNGNTALHIATQKSYTDLIKLLLELGADSNTKNTYGTSTLLDVLAKGNLTAAEELLTHGAEVNAQDNNGNTALHIAIEKSYDDFVKNLKNAGADINIKNKINVTPLQLAASYHKKELITMLLNGQDPSLQDFIKTMYLNDLDACMLLLSCCKTSPLILRQGIIEFNYYALSRGNQQLVNICHTSIKNFMNTTVAGHYPLHLAVMHGNNNIAHYLVEQCNADVNQADYYGLTPLHYAAIFDNYELCAYLIKKKCLINPTSIKKCDAYQENSTPCDLAIQLGLDNIAQLLLAHGAKTNIYHTNFTPSHQADHLALFVDAENEDTKNTKPLAAVNVAFSQDLNRLIKQKACSIIVIGQHLLLNALKLSCSLKEWCIVEIIQKNVSSYILVPPQLINYGMQTTKKSLDDQLQKLGFDLTTLQHNYVDEAYVRNKQFKDCSEKEFSSTIPIMLNALLIPQSRAIFWGGHGCVQPPAKIGNLLKDDALKLINILATKKTKTLYISSCFLGGKNTKTMNARNMIIITAATTEIAALSKNGTRPANWKAFFNGLSKYIPGNQSKFCNDLSNESLPLFLTAKPNITNFPHIKFPGEPFKLLPINNQAITINEKTSSANKQLTLENKRLVEIEQSYIKNPIEITGKIPLLISNLSKNIFEKVTINALEKADHNDVLYLMQKLTRAPRFDDSTLENTFIINELNFKTQFTFNAKNNKNKKLPLMLYHIVIQRGPDSNCSIFFSTDKQPTTTNSFGIAYDKKTRQWISYETLSHGEFELYQKIIS